MLRVASPAPKQERSRSGSRGDPMNGHPDDQKSFWIDKGMSGIGLCIFMLGKAW